MSQDVNQMERAPRRGQFQLHLSVADKSRLQAIAYRLEVSLSEAARKSIAALDVKAVESGNSSRALITEMIQVNMSSVEKGRLKAIATALKVSMSEAARKAIDAYKVEEY